jgi:hypothetical protein
VSCVAIRQEKIESFAVPMEIPADPDQETDSNEQSLLREKKLLEKLQMCQKMRIENPELSLRQLAQMTGTSRVTLTKYRIIIPSS